MSSLYKSWNFELIQLTIFIWVCVSYNLNSACGYQWGPTCQSSSFTAGSRRDTFPWRTPRKRQDDRGPHPGLFLVWGVRTSPLQIPRSQHSSTSLLRRLRKSEGWPVSGNHDSALSHGKDVHGGRAEDGVDQLPRGSAAVGWLQRGEPTFRRVLEEVPSGKRRVQGVGRGLPRTLAHNQGHSWAKEGAAAASSMTYRGLACTWITKTLSGCYM